MKRIKDKITKKLLNVVYPRKCMFCRTHISSAYEYSFCQNCLSSLPYTKNGGCFEVIGEAKYLIAPLFYKEKVKRAIRDLKFKAKSENAEVLALLISGYLCKNEQVMKSDVIIPVPLSEKSLLKRGFNQTELIAKKLSECIGVPLCEDALVKTRETKRQSTLSTFLARAQNVFDAYECIKDMHGKSVILLDDVYTSGMTMYNCAKVLKDKGAKEIIAVVAANAHKDSGYSLHDYKASRIVFKSKK